MLALNDPFLVAKADQVNIPRFYTAQVEKLILSRDRSIFFEARRGEAR